MSRRITTIGLAALCALALSAVAASGASAAGATAFTCIEGGGAHNTNSHCVPGSSGSFGHVAIAEGENTQLTVKGIEGNKTILTAEIAGNPLRLEGTNLECIGCMVEDKTVGGTMEFTGSGGQIMFTGVTITSGGMLETNCEVANHTVTTEPLKFTTTSATGVTLEPVAANRILAKIHFVSQAGHTCSINGAEVPIKGTVPATFSGATLKVNVLEGTTLEIGEGEPVGLSGEATLEAGLTEGVHHAAAVTVTAAGATAFTCIEGGGAHNTNSHCVPGSSGGFGHVAIAEAENTQLTLKGIAGVESVLKGEVAGNPIELRSNGIECIGCMVEDKTVGGTMEFTGSGGQIMFTGVIIRSGGALEANCEVLSQTVTTEPLKVTTTSATGATIEPVAANRILAKVHFVSKAGHTCSLNGAEVPVKGTVPATFSGATLKVNVAEGTTLEIGEEEPASLTGEATLEAGLTEGVHHAVALTAT